MRLVLLLLVCGWSSVPAHAKSGFLPNYEDLLDQDKKSTTTAVSAGGLPRSSLFTQGLPRHDDIDDMTPDEVEAALKADDEAYHSKKTGEAKPLTEESLKADPRKRHWNLAQYKKLRTKIAQQYEAFYGGAGVDTPDGISKRAEMMGNLYEGLDTDEATLRAAQLWTVNHNDNVLDQDEKFFRLLEYVKTPPVSTTCAQDGAAWESGFRDALDGTHFLTTHMFFEKMLAKDHYDQYACAAWRPTTETYDRPTSTYKTEHRVDKSAADAAINDRKYACCSAAYMEGMKRVEFMMEINSEAGAVCRDDYSLGLLGGTAACDKCVMPALLIRRPACFSLGFMKTFAHCQPKLDDFMMRTGDAISNRDRKLMEEKAAEGAKSGALSTEAK